MKRPAASIAFYGPYEALEGAAAEGVAILGFPTMAVARGGRRSRPAPHLN